jgi:uncharacterized cupin superfamily protein
MVPKASLEQTDEGLVAKPEGWYVLNAKDARWYYADGRPAHCDLEGDAQFSQLGFSLGVLWPGQPMAMYHWEADQEDFLVLSGEALLLVEGEERPLVAWDFFHCPAEVRHVIIGAGDGPCVVIAVGARDKSVDSPDWGGYPVDELALRHGAGVDEETNDPDQAYAAWTRRQPVRYGGWLD